MARFVVEPAVAVKWFVPEEHSSAASRLLDGGNDLLGPDSLPTDAARLLAAKVGHGELAPDEAVLVMEAIESIPLNLQPAHGMIEPALRMAVTLGLGITDALGLTAAVHGECRLVTARRDLYEKIQGTPFARHLKWVGDIR